MDVSLYGYQYILMYHLKNSSKKHQQRRIRSAVGELILQEKGKRENHVRGQQCPDITGKISVEVEKSWAQNVALALDRFRNAKNTLYEISKSGG